MMEKGQKGELGARVTTLLIISPHHFISALSEHDIQFIPLDQTPGYCVVSTRVCTSLAPQTHVSGSQAERHERQSIDHISTLSPS